MGARFNVDEVEDYYKSPPQRVQVRVLEVEWLNKNLNRFYQFLKVKGDTDLYDNEIIKILLSCERGYTRQILMLGLLPYVIYMVCVLVYFTKIMSYSEETRDPSWFEGPVRHVACRSLIMIFSVWLMVMEFRQIIFFRKAYFTDVYNSI